MSRTVRSISRGCGPQALSPEPRHARAPVVSLHQGERARRIGVLMNVPENEPNAQARFAAFLQGMQKLGWADGRNIRIDTRWGGNDAKMRKNAAELVALAPEIIVAAGSASMGPLMQISGTVPIVFLTVPDPVGAGYVNSLARPGGNATGFLLFEYSIGGKWLDLLKQIAPEVNRVALIAMHRDAALVVEQSGAVQLPRGSASMVRSSPRRRRSAWKRTQSICGTPPKSSATSQRLQQLRVVG